MSWHETWDFVVVGSGGGAIVAGLAMRDLGKRVLLIEKTDKIGGSTAMSGGVLWIPNHPLQKAAGVPDSYEAGLKYMNAVIGDAGPGSSSARKDAYLRQGPAMVEFLLGKGLEIVRAEGWSDYYDEMPGGSPRGRSLVPRMYDLRDLGEWNQKLRRGPIDLPIMSVESTHLMLAKRSVRGFLMGLRFMSRILKNRYLGRQLSSFGLALQGRMLKLAADAGVEFKLNSPVTELVEEDGRIVGVVIQEDGRERRIRAVGGVLLNTGGFALNAEMRKKYLPQPSAPAWSNANPGETGEMLNIAVAHGAATDLLDQVIWIPSTLPPNSPKAAFAITELAKPHLIVVDKTGRRFANEAGSYMEFGQRMFAAGAVPAYILFDSRYRSNYPWIQAPPGVTPQEWLDSGYMKKADTLEALARRCGIDAQGLQDTVVRFNEFARKGEDPDFKRGARHYDRFFADYTNKPNPSLGALDKPPYYAVELVPGDVGTFGGIVADEYARVVKQDGSVLQGLYACGNCTASVLGRCYPGAGGSLGASYVFGFIAARHAAGANA